MKAAKFTNKNSKIWPEQIFGWVQESKEFIQSIKSRLRAERVVTSEQV